MKRLALTLLLVLLAPPASADCVGCTIVGGSMEVDTSTDYVHIVGDLQNIGTACARWGGDGSPAELACSNAQLSRYAWLVDYAESAYAPSVHVAVGDITNHQHDDERQGLRGWLESLSPTIQGKFLMVPGNHDANSTNCGSLWKYFDDPFMQIATTGQNEQDLWWERGLRRTRILGIAQPLLGGYGYEGCQESDEVTPVNLYDPVCYGVPAGGGAKASGVACAAASECASLKCGDWSALYEDHMRWIEGRIQLFRADPTDTSLLIVGHIALCKAVSFYTECDGTDAFSRMQDQMVCTGPTADVVCGSVQTCTDARTGGTSETCTVARVVGDTSYDTRSRFKAAIDDLKANAGDTRKTIIWASGHVGTAPQQTTPLPVMDAVGTGVEYLSVETPGAQFSPSTSIVKHSAVVQIPHGAAPSVAEWIGAPNNAPVIDEIGTAGTVTIALASLPYDIVFTGTDADYGDLVWSVSGEDVCMSFADGGAGTTPAALLGTLTVGAGCTAKTYSAITVTLSDGDAAQDQTTPLTVVVTP